MAELVPRPRFFDPNLRRLFPPNRSGGLEFISLESRHDSFFLSFKKAWLEMEGHLFLIHYCNNFKRFLEINLEETTHGTTTLTVIIFLSLGFLPAYPSAHHFSVVVLMGQMYSLGSIFSHLFYKSFSLVSIFIIFRG